MTRVAIYSDPDGTLHLVVPTEEVRRPGEGDDALCRRIAEKDVPAGVDWRIVDRDEFPDRTYRQAWRDDGDAIVLDPEVKADIDAAIEAAEEATP